MVLPFHTVDIYVKIKLMATVIGVRVPQHCWAEMRFETRTTFTQKWKKKKISTNGSTERNHMLVARRCWAGDESFKWFLCTIFNSFILWRIVCGYARTLSYYELWMRVNVCRNDESSSKLVEGIFGGVKLNQMWPRSGRWWWNFISFPHNSNWRCPLDTDIPVFHI